jgi:MFS family permease
MRQPRWSDVYLAAGARGISVAGDFVAATALVLVLQERGAGGSAVAALLLAASVPPVVLAPLTGRIADRADSRRVIVVVALLQTLCCLAMVGTASPALLIALTALLATGVAITQPVFAALVPAMVGEQNVPRAGAISQTATSIGMLAGPVLAGVLVGLAGLRLPLLVNAASFLAIAVVGVTLKTRRHRVSVDIDRSHGTATPPAGAPHRLRRDRLLVLTLALVGVVVSAACIADVAVVFFVRDTLHGSAIMYGVVAASWIAGLVPGSWAVARLKVDDRGYVASLVLGLLLISVALAGGGLAPTVGWIIPAFLVGGIGNGAQTAAAGVLIVRRTPDANRGRAFAVLGAVTNGATAAGFVMGGALLETLSPRLVIVGSGLAALLLAVALTTPAITATRWPRSRVRRVASP